MIAYLPSSLFTSDEDYNEHLAALRTAWDTIVNANVNSGLFKPSRKELRSIHIVRTAAVLDMGIIGPKVRLSLLSYISLTFFHSTTYTRLFLPLLHHLSSDITHVVEIHS